MKRIAIVCPVFNEEEAIPLFHARLERALAGCAGYEFELLFTNNCSTDRTLDVILELRQRDPRVQVLTFSRNFGYQASVLAGLRHARGDAMVVIDVDCEDPPEMIPRFIAEWEGGMDIVYGRREGRPEHAAILFMRRAFYRLNRLIADNDIILDMAEFSLVASHVRDAMLDNDSTYPFLRGEIAYVGFRRKAIPYDREKRICGQSHYNFSRMVEFAIGGILSSTTFPLRLAVYVLPLMLALDLYLACSARGDLSLLVGSALGYLMFCAGMLCLYLARTYKNGVRRPVFIVDWRRSTLERSRG